MANPNGNLAGYTDPEEEGWQERAMDAVRERQRKPGRKKRRTRGTFLYYDDPLRIYVDEACRRRDISFAGYARRALIAFLAYDLDIPSEELFEHVAQPRPYGNITSGHPDVTHDNGLGHGPWEIAHATEKKC